MITNLSEQHSIVSHWMSKVRDKNLHEDRKIFRTYARRISEVMAYEISKTMVYKSQEVTTPKETTLAMVLQQQPVVISVLRAGLVMHEGLLSFFDEAESGFVAAYRKGLGKNQTIEVSFDYASYPDLNGKDIIICDPMLATGSCLKAVIDDFRQKFTVKSIHIATMIATQEGIQYIQSSGELSIWVAAIDRGLDANKYILPGLGDAGDLAFGEKL